MITLAMFTKQSDRRVRRQQLGDRGERFKRLQYHLFIARLSLGLPPADPFPCVLRFLRERILLEMEGGAVSISAQQTKQTADGKGRQSYVAYHFLCFGTVVYVATIALGIAFNRSTTESHGALHCTVPWHCVCVCSVGIFSNFVLDTL